MANEIGIPNPQETDLLAQMLQQRNAVDPETAADLATQRNQYMAGVSANTNDIINAATTSNQQYQGISEQARNTIMSNAEQQAIIAARQIALSGQSAEANTTITDNVNTARNNTMLQVGGIQALDSLGMKLQQAMALNEQKQLAAQQAVKSSNPIVEGLLSAFGIKSQAQAAVEEADMAQEYYSLTLSQRKDLVSAMSSADSLVTQLGTALNGATQKAALENVAIKAASDAASLQAQALSNDAQSMLKLANMEMSEVQHNFNTLNTVYQAQRQQLSAEFQLMGQSIREAGSTKAKGTDYVKSIGATMGLIDTGLQKQFLEAAQAKDDAGMQAAQAEADALMQAGALLGLTPQNKSEWAGNSAVIKRIAEGKKANKADSEVIMELNNPLFTSRFMASNPQLASGASAVYNPASISAIENLIGGFARLTHNGAAKKPLTPQEVSQVNANTLEAIAKEAANPFRAGNKVIRMDAAALIAVTQTNPDNALSKSPVTQFLLNRYKENPKAVISLEDYKSYVINNAQLGAFGTRFNQQAFTEVIRHMNTLYSDVVSRSGVRVYGADYKLVPKEIHLFAQQTGALAPFKDATRIPITNPDALSRAFKNVSGVLSPNVDELSQATSTPIQNLFMEEGAK